jgi:hypothetical protein
MLRGVPNTGFTEALAFTFQSRDMQLLGIEIDSDYNDYLNTLDIFWGCYEIMGVALVDMQVWEWMYNHPEATAQDLKNAVVTIAKEIWNTYYEPIFKVKDQVILAVYSHSIDSPLYLANYPIGHLIDFQFETYLKGKNIGTEVERMFKIGRKTPNLWMQEAVGQGLSTESLLTATSTAIERVKEIEKAQKKK